MYCIVLYNTQYIEQLFLAKYIAFRHWSELTERKGLNVTISDDDVPNDFEVSFHVWRRVSIA